MPSRREGDDYIHHQPKSGEAERKTATWVREGSMTVTAVLVHCVAVTSPPDTQAVVLPWAVAAYHLLLGGSPAPQQFTWQEGSCLTLITLSYLLGFGIHISILVDKYNLEEPPKNRGLYLAFFLLPHLTSGLKNLQYHYREAQEEEGEDGSLGWALHLLLFPFSPLLRIFRAWRFGLAEKDDRENGIRFVDETVTVGVLRLLEVLVGDAPTLCLLVRDDVWGRSADWSDRIVGSPDLIRCGPNCIIQPDNPLGFWMVCRMFFLLSKMAQSVVFYLTAVKRLQRLQNPEHYTHLRGRSTMQGRLNVFAVLILYIAHFFFIGSRIMGYSMVSAAWGSWVYLIAGGHWLLNTGWHLITILNSGGLTAARSVSSLIMGGVWLITLTNEQGGRQLGRFIMYYLLAFSESAVCGYLWNIAMKGSGDFFAYKAPWSLLIVFMFGLMAHMIYYSLCHPGTPSITKQGLLCCSGNRRDPLDSDRA